MSEYKVRPIRNAIVMLTNQCNCRCVYCFEERTNERMTLDTAKDVLAFLHRSGSRQPGFTFFGGEPMLEYETIIKPIVEYAKDAFPVKTRFAMTTNGTLFTNERLDFFKENDINFMLSMDGSRTAQSCNRPLKNGQNSFDVVSKYVPYILELWPMQSFRETLTEYNANSFFEDILYFDSIGCRNLMVVPDIFKQWDEEKIEALAEQIKQYEAYIIKHFRANERPFLTHEYSMAFKKIMSLHQMKGYGRRSSSRCSGCQQCGFGVRGSASIDPQGDIYGCHHISPLSPKSDFYLGNIYKGINENRVRRLVDAYDEQLVGNEDCKTCGLDWICDGGCAPNNYQINGDVHKVPKMHCIWWRLITDSAYRIANILGSEENELFSKTFVEGVTRGW